MGGWPTKHLPAGRSDWAERRFRRQPFILLSFSSSKKPQKAQETQSYQRFQCIGHTDFNTSGTNDPRGETGASPPSATAQSCATSEITLYAVFVTPDSATLLYTYISRFSVNPHYQQQFYLRPYFIAFFNLSHKRPTFAFMRESGYTLGFRRRIAHSGLHGETRAFRTGGGITTLGAFCAVRKPCVAGYQNGVLCRFWVLVGDAPEERREPAEQRCAYARRCSEASRPRWAALLCLQLGDVTVLSLCAQYFLNVRGEGWYHYPRRALRAAETPDGRLSKRLTCRFLRSGSLH